ncbi:MAG: pyridoxamine 5'-phosphate oxidase family protein [Chloroflexota bacterium]
MAVLTEAMKEMIATFQCFVATVSTDGTPDVGPKRSTRVVDDEHLAFNEVTGKQTLTNILHGSKVAIAVVDREKLQGYRFLGTPEVIIDGPVFDQAVEAMRQRGLMAPLRAVIQVKIEHIYNLGLPGAGELID